MRYRPFLMVLLTFLPLQSPADAASSAEAKTSNPFDELSAPPSQLVCTCRELQGDDRDTDLRAQSIPPAPAWLPAPVRKKIVVHHIDFDPNTAVIRPEAFPVLQEAAALLTGDGPIVLTVNEPTDSRPSVAYRSILARRRAKAVRRFLVRHGSADKRVTAKRVTIEGLDQPPPSLADGGAHSRPAELHVE